MVTTATETRHQDGFAYYKAVFQRTAPFDWDANMAWHAACAEMQDRKSTVAGRNALRDEGWQLADDPNPQYRE